MSIFELRRSEVTQRDSWGHGHWWHHIVGKEIVGFPIVMEGIPYANGFDDVFEYNGCWAISPTGIEVEGPGCWATIVIGCWATVDIGCWVVALDPAISATEVTTGGKFWVGLLMAIWSMGNNCIVRVLRSNSLKLCEFRNGIPTRGVPREAWTWVGVSCIIGG